MAAAAGGYSPGQAHAEAEHRRPVPVGLFGSGTTFDRMTDPGAFRLTQYAHGGGCACKIPPGELEETIARLVPEDPGTDLIVGVDHGHQRNAKLQLTVTLSPAEPVPGLYVHPDHRRRLRRSPVRSRLDV